ncbi:hypothetical protein K1T71_009255 [Dendrolimus kikuchii]|uniref:Uncharacterized protein n=1 Tax=Dendrolimus kikuchii TaxID=765133 RepID=A0ACC1CTY9_9NEOP|nr:hypothetical protein K1T71_009255 [Dendrolimus kikuchii]
MSGTPVRLFTNVTNVSNGTYIMVFILSILAAAQKIHHPEWHVVAPSNASVRRNKEHGIEVSVRRNQEHGIQVSGRRNKEHGIEVSVRRNKEHGIEVSVRRNKQHGIEVSVRKNKEHGIEVSVRRNKQHGIECVVNIVHEKISKIGKTSETSYLQATIPEGRQEICRRDINEDMNYSKLGLSLDCKCKFIVALTKISDEVSFEA